MNEPSLFQNKTLLPLLFQREYVPTCHVRGLLFMRISYKLYRLNYLHLVETTCGFNKDIELSFK